MAHLTGVFRLGRDAEKVEGKSGPFLRLALAYDAYAGGESKTQWISATFGGSRVDAVADKLTKGTAIYAALADPHVALYQAKDGTTKASIEARCMDFDFAGGPKPAEAPAGD